ncbi:MAG: adenosine deaminase [Flammeovirgaceae bacterium]
MMTAHPYRLFILLLLIVSNIHGLLAQKQSADELATSTYFESIRSNEALLTAFLNAMPKGGDIHHHFSGSVYGETYLEFVKNASHLWINTETLKIEDEKPTELSESELAKWMTIGELKASEQFEPLKELLLRRWSVKDYNFERPGHEQFFESFDYFGVASRPTLKKSLLLMKERAKKESVQYIETQFKSVKLNGIDLSAFERYDSLLHAAQTNRDEAQVEQLLKQLQKELDIKSLQQSVDFYNDWIKDLHKELAIDDQRFTMRYQAFVKRFQNPSKLFINTVANFMAADQNHLVVGVNILAPEHKTVSMSDYWLHMQFFKFCHKLFPKVKYSMHAGELVLGMVKPEELTWHISEAVYTAAAHRIGHGVAIYHENNCYELLNYMKSHEIAVEINLSSNEFILGVQDDAHPITLYHAFGVPIVISTDDAGVLRNNLCQQFVLLAQRYPQFSYADIKQFVYNSITYSFIEKSSVKKRLKVNLDRLFTQFEHSIVQYTTTQKK